MRWLLITAGFLLAPAVVRADPFEGRLPARAGETFAGIVRYVGDVSCTRFRGHPVKLQPSAFRSPSG